MIRGSKLIRTQICTLGVAEVFYQSRAGTTESTSHTLGAEKALEALANADREGIFPIKGRDKNSTGHEGAITRIRFAGTRWLTREEMAQMTPYPDHNFLEEAITYNFKYWLKEGKPLRLVMERREEYDPVDPASAGRGNSK